MEYHVGRDQQQLGKFTEQQIREGLFDGRFLKTDLLWHEGMDGWKPLSEVLSSPSSDVSPTPEVQQSLAAASSSPNSPVATTPTFSAPPAPPYGPPPSPYVTPPAGFGGTGPMAVGARPTSGTAIASLILGIVSLIGIMCYVGFFTGIAGIICGHLALSTIRKSNQTLDGKGLAIAGLVLNYLSVVISLLFIAFMVFVMTNWDGTNFESTNAPTEWPATPPSTSPAE